MKEQFPAVVNFAAAPHSVEVRPMPAPEIGPDDVLLEVAYVGVCGSDLHRWLGTASVPANYPVILGHEYAGRIAAVGGEVTGFATGDRVVGETAAVIDPDSPLTRRGLYQLDPRRRGFGYGVHGAMTRYLCVPQRCLHRVPAQMPLQIAALTEPCCVAYNAVANHAGVTLGDRVIVIGPGPIGVLCAAMAQLQGGDAMLLGLPADRARLEVARAAFGLRVSDGVPDDLQADVVIDAAGASASLRTALEVVRPGGRITKVGWGPQPVDYSLDPLVQKNVTLQGSYSHNWIVWERVIELLARGRLVVDALIGGIWELNDWQKAFADMAEGRVLKSLLAVAPTSE